MGACCMMYIFYVLGFGFRYYLNLILNYNKKKIYVERWYMYVYSRELYAVCNKKETLCYWKLYIWSNEFVWLWFDGDPFLLLSRAMKQASMYKHDVVSSSSRRVFYLSYRILTLVPVLLSSTCLLQQKTMPQVKGIDYLV